MIVTYNKETVVSKRDLKCLKEWKDQYEEAFPEYISKSDKSRICELYSSKDKFLTEFETKYIEKNLKKH
jgi:hypothetical protein|uniref:hypothetical protein n=1 Tax=Gelidibacter sp. TaxID=2018083 RepID=UPI0040494D1E